MANASMNVALTEPRTVEIARTAAPGKGTRGESADEASKSDKRSFADALREAEGASRKSERAVSENAKEAEHRKGNRPSNAGLKNKGIKALPVPAAKGPKIPDLGSKTAPRADNFEIDRNGLADVLVQEDRPKTAQRRNPSEQPDTAILTLAAAGDSQRAEPVRESGKPPEKKSRDAAAPAAPKSDTVRSIDAPRPAAGRSNPGLTSEAPRVQVADRRNFAETMEQAGAEKTTVTKRRTDGEAPSPASRSGTETPSVRTSDFSVAETDIELSPSKPGMPTERSAAAELARKLDAQAGNEIVRQVKVVLNRSDAGEVRINLRPDNLGRVRVRIQMEDNRLTGRIFVESAAAREAFRNALDGLQARLVESGFGSADLELAWDDSSGQFAQGDRKGGKQAGNADQALREFENTVPTTVVDEAAADARVNMVV